MASVIQISFWDAVRAVTTNYRFIHVPIIDVRKCRYQRLHSTATVYTYDNSIIRFLTNKQGNTQRNNFGTWAEKITLTCCTHLRLLFLYVKIIASQSSSQFLYLQATKEKNNVKNDISSGFQGRQATVSKNTLSYSS